MNFLDGGWMLLVVVALWFLVYLPNWGSKNSDENKVSTKSRNSPQRRPQISKNASNGVSNLRNRSKNFRLFRAIFSLILLASVVGILYGVAQAFANPMMLTVSAVSLAVLTIAVSVLRSTRVKISQRPHITPAELDAQRRRMAYFIRESALSDAKPDELFDERAWSDVALPDSLINRKLGYIETSSLAEVVSFEQIKSAATEKKLASEELDLILKRRRASN